MVPLSYSAALYCECDYDGHVSEEWLEGVIALFKSLDLPIREYGVADNPVCSGGTYAFRTHFRQLLTAVRTGTLRLLDLYCHRHKQKHLLMNWEGVATIDLSRGYAHLGLPAITGIGFGDLLRQTYMLAKWMAPWRYGIGYSHPTGKAPCMYAVGVLGGPDYPDPNDSEEEQDRVAAWDHELHGRRRHLQGYFRDVYPANFLSATHVNVRVTKTKTLLKAGWGEFTTLDDGLWLWTVPEKDIPKARAALIRAKVLLCP